MGPTDPGLALNTNKAIRGEIALYPELIPGAKSMQNTRHNTIILNCHSDMSRILFGTVDNARDKGRVHMIMPEITNYIQCSSQTQCIETMCQNRMWAANVETALVIHNTLTAWAHTFAM